MTKNNDDSLQDNLNPEKDNTVQFDDLEIESQTLTQEKTATEKDSKTNEEVIEFSKTKIELLKRLVRSQKENLEKINNLLSGIMNDDEARISIGQLGAKQAENIEAVSEGQIVEGVFDGESMIGPDGKQYSIPANYASKSKLVEGDILKLTITSKGTFVYKQIGPIDRNRVIGVIEQDSNGNFKVSAGDKVWRVLTASVTYFKGQDGDEIIILVPKVGESKWAAVENIVRK